MIDDFGTLILSVQGSQFVNKLTITLTGNSPASVNPYKSFNLFPVLDL